ncbi:acylase [Aggregicoccus sp. 17bor-14]|uniref:acylase n=1 Tax=Myxococcaceae TaxID=31 RepID=UPI00129CB2CB|nr:MULTISPECIES: acylase [Myxococcaceae]MBF5042027.1 acylase [Simulacricoccus sp. 17bor-14]MRI87807.1 acylase [Aggregicoccus sp. 17bor-14]
MRTLPALLASALLLLLPLHAHAKTEDAARWAKQAKDVTIVRDDWGIAHVYGKSDADAVFGMMYAQAEDDFNRVETNYLNALGRLAEAEGEAKVWQDLRMKLFIDPKLLQAEYAKAPAWLQALCRGWADGLNYFLATHPQVKPRVLTRFEPWMPLAFSEGSIGGDIERVSLAELEAFYGEGTKRPEPAAADAKLKEPSGSNGFAIAPANTAAKHALLLINPHTSFFFRSEAQVVSEQGLNAYGASTWGQFFVYQGFNDRLGWMHTSSGADAVDEYAEAVVRKGEKLYYRYGKALRLLVSERIRVPYRTAAGATASREVTVYRTHHGPIVRSQDGTWVSIRLMQRPVEALSQSYLRTKARDLKAFRKAMDLHANSSNNTVYADADGNIAYFHPQFVPRRDDQFDWTKPVDGSDPRTEWGAPHGIEDSPHLLNPPNGWIQNTNNWPYTSAGPYSPKQAQFPRYMDTFGENPRGVHAVRVLEGKKDFTLDSLLAAAFDSWLPYFAENVPKLVAAWEALPATDPLRARLAEPVALLRTWDFRWSAASVPTSLAVYWGQELWQGVKAQAEKEGIPMYRYLPAHTSPGQQLQALAGACERLKADFGTWRTAWGDINRFQRLTGDIVQPFDDKGPSIPVPFTSAQWGSLASFGARTYPGTKRMYGTSGNSFVAVVEFTPEGPRARAVTAGGESGDPKSPHFNDQAGRYASGDLREVYFTRAQLHAHTEREYHPGG